MSCLVPSLPPPMVALTRTLPQSLPPPKRARYFPPDQDYNTLVAGPASHAYYFEDGDLVLGVEDLFFKIHSSRLAAQSNVFADMLNMPQPVVIESVDGCPFVRLSDSAKDWIVALEYLYDSTTFLLRPVIFDSLAGALRVSTKYDITRLRHWAITQLRTTWPTHLDQMGPMALPHAAEAIVLARACDVPEILPSAFYALSVQKWRAGADGGRSHLVLSQSDMRRLIAGREALQDILVDTMGDPLPRSLSLSDYLPPSYPSTSSYRAGSCSRASTPCDTFVYREMDGIMLTDPGSGSDTASSPSTSSTSDAPIGTYSFCSAPCRPRLEAFWRSRLAPDSGRPWGTWLLRELHRMAMVSQYELSDPMLEGICDACWAEHRRLAMCRLDLLKEVIPKLFML